MVLYSHMWAHEVYVLPLCVCVCVCACICFQCPGVDKVGDPYILNVPLGCISHVEKMGRSRNKGEHSYGLEIHCKVSGISCIVSVCTYICVCVYVHMHVCVCVQSGGRLPIHTAIRM